MERQRHHRFFAPDFSRMGFLPFDDNDDEFEEEDEYDYGGFFSFQGHPNGLAMRQRISEVNEKWNRDYPDEFCSRSRVSRVRFNSDRQVIMIQDVEEDTWNDEETGSVASTSTSSWTGMVPGSSQGNVVQHHFSSHIENSATCRRVVEEYETRFLGSQATTLEQKQELHGNQSPQSNASQQESSLLSSNNLSPKLDPTDERCSSVIRAVFNPKSLAALQKLQQAQMLPLVRTQVRKRNLSMDMLAQIFSDKFVKLIFNDFGTNPENQDTTADKLKKDSELNNQEAPEGMALLNPTRALGERGDTGLSSRIREKSVLETVTQDKEEVKEEGSVPTPPIHKPIETTEAINLNLDKNEAFSLPSHVPDVPDGGDIPFYVPSDSKPKVRPSTAATHLPPKSNSKAPTSSLGSKKKSRHASRTPEENALSRKYPLIDADWLDRKIKTKVTGVPKGSFHPMERRSHPKADKQSSTSALPTVSSKAKGHGNLASRQSSVSSSIGDTGKRHQDPKNGKVNANSVQK